MSKTTYKDASNVGWLFEDAAHLTLAQGGTFEFRDLNAQQRGVLELPRRTLRVVWAGLQEFLGLAAAGEFQGFYMAPESRSAPVADSAEGGADEVHKISFNLHRKLFSKALNNALRPKKELNLVYNWVRQRQSFYSSQPGQF